ncbi:MAG TPA: 3-dehydroquinate synthase [Gammaproteobacteria bacterium]|nr:3-dehydroquinate synthase [Gammaproteobacteria bacterium]
MRTLTIDLGERSYPIYIGRNILEASLLAKHLGKGRVLVVSNETVAPLLRPSLDAMLSGRDYNVLQLPDGEIHKNLDILNEIYSFLLAHNYDRSCTLIACGGGVVGDITGFAAATYQRGVNYIQIPTTLLAQVDSSVGGKTAVNHALGKNMIGAFYQPLCVISDTAVLESLPPRELSAGLAEVIKYGLIRDSGFTQWLEDNIGALLAREHGALVHAIEHSCRTKAAIVASDEREQGIRALLNLGHTFGHAIETHTGYSSWLHGEAVGAGMAMAAEFSRRRGWLKIEDVMRTRGLIRAAQLPLAPPAGMTADNFLKHMQRDKKVQNGRIRLVLLKAIGDAVITDEYPAELLREFLQSATAPAQ